MEPTAIEPRCPVCSSSLCEPIETCPSCRTQHHAECWSYARGCAIYGCKTAAPADTDPAGDSPPLAPKSLPHRAREPRDVPVWCQCCFGFAILASLCNAAGAGSMESPVSDSIPYFNLQCGVATLVWVVVCIRRRRLWRLPFGFTLAVFAMVMPWQFVPSQDAREATCANCRTFMAPLFLDYAKKHDGWYPCGGTDPWDSLGRAAATVPFGDASSTINGMSSHWTRSRIWNYFYQHGSLCAEVCAFAYNEGVRSSDPDELLVLYSKRSTDWECSHHPNLGPGRVCVTKGDVASGITHGQFLDEAEFQKLQGSTLAVIARRTPPPLARVDAGVK